jgi:hypothetical protein
MIISSSFWLGNRETDPYDCLTLLLIANTLRQDRVWLKSEFGLRGSSRMQRRVEWGRRPLLIAWRLLNPNSHFTQIRVSLKVFAISNKISDFTQHLSDQWSMENAVDIARLHGPSGSYLSTRRLCGLWMPAGSRRYRFVDRDFEFCHSFKYIFP